MIRFNYIRTSRGQVQREIQPQIKDFPAINEKTLGEGARKRKQREKKEHWWLWWGERPANYLFLYIMFYSNGRQGRRRFMLLPKMKIASLVGS